VRGGREGGGKGKERARKRVAHGMLPPLSTKRT